MATDNRRTYDAQTTYQTLTGAAGYTEWVKILSTPLYSRGAVAIQNRGVNYDDTTPATLEVYLVQTGGTAPTVAGGQHGEYIPVTMGWYAPIWSDTDIYVKTDTDNTTIVIVEEEDKVKDRV